MIQCKTWPCTSPPLENHPNLFTILGKKYEVVAKSQLKKMTKLWAQEIRKAAEKEKRDAEAAEATRKRAEEAKKIVIEENKSLEPAVRIKIDQGEKHREKRVKVMFYRQGFTLGQMILMEIPIPPP